MFGGGYGGSCDFSIEACSQTLECKKYFTIPSGHLVAHVDIIAIFFATMGPNGPFSITVVRALSKSHLCQKSYCPAVSYGHTPQQALRISRSMMRCSLGDSGAPRIRRNIQPMLAESRAIINALAQLTQLGCPAHQACRINGVKGGCKNKQRTKNIPTLRYAKK